MVRSPFLLVALAGTLAACGGSKNSTASLDSLDGELTNGASIGNTRDPALMSALQSQIMVDPTLAQQANSDAVRPPSQPLSGAVPPDTGPAPATPAVIAATATSETLKTTPAASADCPQCTAARQSLTLGALASRQSDRRTASCVGDLHYSARWANRLPADLPLYPDARVSEAAGAADNGCALRAVSFATAAPLQTVLDYYYTRTTNAGYAAGHQADGDEHVLGGTRARDAGAFTLFLTARADGGTNVDLLANNGS